MDIIKQILESFSGTLPNDSKTAAAIARNAPPEEISACATDEGLHALAGALFEACEEGGGDNAVLDSDSHVTAHSSVVCGSSGKRFHQAVKPPS